MRIRWIQRPLDPLGRWGIVLECLTGEFGAPSRSFGGYLTDVTFTEAKRRARLKLALVEPHWRCVRIGLFQGDAIVWWHPVRAVWRPLGAPDAGWTNPCGGTRWRTLPDGAIEVEGRGVLLPAGSGPYSYRTYVENSWRNFEPEIRRAAAKRGVPANWILALMATETGILSSSREKQLGFRNYCCAGPMAVMFSPYNNFRTFGGYDSPEAYNDAEANVDTGAAMIRHHVDDGLDLPQISARYNSGGLCCKNSPDVASKPGGRVQNEYDLCSASIAGVSYPEVSIMMNNVAVRELGVGPGLPPPVVQAGIGGSSGGAGVLFVAAAVVGALTWPWWRGAVA